MKQFKLHICIAALLLLSIVAAGCAPAATPTPTVAPTETPAPQPTEQATEAPTQTQQPSPTPEPASSGYPVAVESCDESFSYTTAPERAVVFDIHLIEMMVELDLTERIVGYWTAGSELRPEYQTALDGRNEIEAEWPGPSLEAILGTDADFALGGWGYGFSEDTGVTPVSLSQAGINSYAIRESCASNGPAQATTIEDTYLDVQNVGRIFGVEAKADETVNKMKAEVSAVAERLDPGAGRLTVFLYDDIGEASPFSVGGYGLASNLITLAGGENIFSDLNESWTTVGWETVIARNPDVIVVVDTDWEPAADRIARLKAMPELAGMTAIQNERFVVVHYRQVVPGLRNIEAVQLLAKGFYPERFK